MKLKLMTTLLFALPVAYAQNSILFQDLSETCLLAKVDNEPIPLLVDKRAYCALSDQEVTNLMSDERANLRKWIGLTRGKVEARLDVDRVKLDKKLSDLSLEKQRLDKQYSDLSVATAGLHLQYIDQANIALNNFAVLNSAGYRSESFIGLKTFLRSVLLKEGVWKAISEPNSSNYAEYQRLVSRMDSYKSIVMEK